MKGFYVCACLAISVLLGGCVVNVADTSDSPSWQQTERENRDNLAKLTLGMAREQVLSQMGRADFYEAWQKDGKEVQVLFYRTNWVSGDNRTTKAECTPLLFSNNRLVGWGEGAYQAEQTEQSTVN